MCLVPETPAGFRLQLSRHISEDLLSEVNTYLDVDVVDIRGCLNFKVIGFSYLFFLLLSTIGSNNKQSNSIVATSSHIFGCSLR